MKHLNLKPYEENQKVPTPSEIAKMEGKKMTQHLRFKLTHIEEDYSLWFYRQVFKLFPRWLRITNRTKRNAIEPLNNLLNLSFEVLQWKVMKAVVKSKLEPYLGFLHSEAWGKPSLVCDLVEPFRPYIVHFLLEYCKTLKPEDFKRAFVKNKVPRYLRLVWLVGVKRAHYSVVSVCNSPMSARSTVCLDQYVLSMGNDKIGQMKKILLDF